METLRLTPDEIAQLQNDLTIIRTLPAISLATAINVQRSIKSLDKVIEDIKDDATVLGEKYAALKEKDTEGLKKLQEEEKVLKNTKVEVKLHILKDTDFPKETDKFGVKEVPTPSGNIRKIHYIEAYLQLLDVVIIQANEYEDYIKSLREEQPAKLEIVKEEVKEAI